MRRNRTLSGLMAALGLAPTPTLMPSKHRRRSGKVWGRYRRDHLTLHTRDSKDMHWAERTSARGDLKRELKAQLLAEGRPVTGRQRRMLRKRLARSEGPHPELTPPPGGAAA